MVKTKNKKQKKIKLKKLPEKIRISEKKETIEETIEPKLIKEEIVEFEPIEESIPISIPSRASISTSTPSPQTQEQSLEEQTRDIPTKTEQPKEEPLYDEKVYQGTETQEMRVLKTSLREAGALNILPQETQQQRFVQPVDWKKQENINPTGGGENLKKYVVETTARRREEDKLPFERETKDYEPMK